jgi:hypothetical protein
MAQRTDRVVEHGNVIGVQYRLNREDLRVEAERLHGPKNHGLAADRTILLGSSRAGTKPAPGRDKDGCSPLWMGH